MKNKEEFLNKIIDELPSAEYRGQMTKDEWECLFEDAYNEGYKQAQALQLQQTGVSKRYYFKSTGFNNDTATERCMFKDNGTMIGSIACQKCMYCMEHDKPCDITGEVNWIVCSKIKLAKG